VSLAEGFEHALRASEQLDEETAALLAGTPGQRD
jgi:hypothetical protein